MKKRAVSLSEFIVAMAVLGLISAFLAQFYVLMGRVYDQVSVHSELQRNARQIAAWVFTELREAAPVSASSNPILLPSRTQLISSELCFTRPADIHHPRTTSFETIRYYYQDMILYRESVGSGLAPRQVTDQVSGLSFFWINDYTVRLDLTISRRIKNRYVSAPLEAYITTRYRP